MFQEIKTALTAIIDEEKQEITQLVDINDLGNNIAKVERYGVASNTFEISVIPQFEAAFQYIANKFNQRLQASRLWVVFIQQNKLIIRYNDPQAVLNIDELQEEVNDILKRLFQHPLKLTQEESRKKVNDDLNRFLQRLQNKQESENNEENRQSKKEESLEPKDNNTPPELRKRSSNVVDSEPDSFSNSSEVESDDSSNIVKNEGTIDKGKEKLELEDNNAQPEVIKSSSSTNKNKLKNIASTRIILDSDPSSSDEEAYKKLRKKTSKNSSETSSILDSDSNSSMNNKQKIPNIPGLKYQVVPGNGHCLFQAVAFYTNREQTELRLAVAEYLKENLEDFRQVIIPPVGKTVEDYVKDVEEGIEWADNIEIIILMHVLSRPIVIIGPEGTIRNSIDINDFIKGEPIFVYYNDHNHYDAFLLGEEIEPREILAQLMQYNVQTYESNQESDTDVTSAGEEKQNPKHDVSSYEASQDSDTDVAYSDEEKQTSKKGKLYNYLKASGKRTKSAFNNIKNYPDSVGLMLNVAANIIAALSSPTYGTFLAAGTISNNLIKDTLAVKKHQNRINDYEKKLGNQRSSYLNNFPVFIIWSTFSLLALTLFIILRGFAWEDYGETWQKVLTVFSVIVAASSLLSRKLNIAFIKDVGDKKIEEYKEKHEEERAQIIERDMRNIIREDIREEYINQISELTQTISELKNRLRDEATEPANTLNNNGFHSKFFKKTTSSDKQEIPAIPGLNCIKVSGTGTCLIQAVAISACLDENKLHQTVEKYLRHNPKAILKVMIGFEDLPTNVEIEILMRVLNRPIIIIEPEGRISNLRLIPRFTDDPIFVYYNNNHYDSFVLTEEFTTTEVLAWLRQFAENSLFLETSSRPYYGRFFNPLPTEEGSSSISSSTQQNNNSLEQEDNKIVSKPN